MTSAPIYPWRWLSIVWILAVALASCSRADHRIPVTAETQRFIAENPTETFEVMKVMDSSTVKVWTLEGSDTLADWKVEDPLQDVKVLASRRLTVQTSNTSVVLSHQVDFDAAEVDFFDFLIGGVNRETITLGWVGDETALCEGCSVSLDSSERQADGAARYRFAVGDSLEWKGRIRRLRLTIQMPPSGVAHLYRIESMKTAFNRSKVVEAAARPWKVDVANEVRNAILAVPDYPQRFEVRDLAQAAELDLGVAVLGSRLRMRFRVIAEWDDDAVTEVLSRDIASGDGWVDVRVPIGSPTPRSRSIAALILQCENEDGAGLDRAAFGLWSNPVILAGGLDSRPNVVLISIDTLRSDRMSLYGYPRDTTPELVRWVESRGAVVFENAVAPAPWTLPSHVSMMTGLDAISHGVNYNRGAPESLHMLAEDLSQAGYATAGITGGGFVHPQWGFAQGFDSYSYYASAMGFDAELVEGLDKALEWLERNADRRFFLFFHTYEVHNPFRPRKPYFEKFSTFDPRYSLKLDTVEPSAVDGFLTKRVFSLRIPGQAATVVPIPEEYSELMSDLYDAGVAYMDGIVAQLLARLDDIAVTQPTIVIFTSDHGEMLGEHGLVNHACLYEENIMIPLVVVHPGRVGAGSIRVADQVGLVDVVPTILESLGIETGRKIDGSSLMPFVTGEGRTDGERRAWIYAPGTNYGVALRVDNKRKYQLRNHVWNSDLAKEEYFDLQVDQAEQQNLAVNPDFAAPLEHLRSQVDARFNSTHRGLRIRILNRRDEGGLTGRLFGSMISVVNLKTDRLVEDRFSWTEGGVDINIRPGDDFHIWAENVSRGDLSMRLKVGEYGTVLSKTVDCSDLIVPRTFFFQSGQWLTREGETGAQIGDVGLEFSWTGNCDSAGSEGPVNDGVLQQLKALGYTE